MSQIRAAITGIQGYLPDYILTNAELEKMMLPNAEKVKDGMNSLLTW